MKDQIVRQKIVDIRACGCPVLGVSPGLRSPGRMRNRATASHQPWLRLRYHLLHVVRQVRDIDAGFDSVPSASERDLLMHYCFASGAAWAAMRIVRAALREPKAAESLDSVRAFVIASAELRLYLRRLHRLGAAGPHWPVRPGEFLCYAGDSSLRNAMNFAGSVETTLTLAQHLYDLRRSAWSGRLTDVHVFAWRGETLRALREHWYFGAQHDGDLTKQLKLLDIKMQDESNAALKSVRATPIPPRFSLTVDLMREIATFEGHPHQLRSAEQALVLKKLLDREGLWMSASDLKEIDRSQQRPGRLIDGLPEPIRDHISTKPGRGFRLDLLKDIQPVGSAQRRQRRRRQLMA